MRQAGILFVKLQSESMRFSPLYEFGLFLLGLAAVPKFCYQLLVHNKYRASIRERLGLVSHRIQKRGQKVIWIHAVSVGETKAIAPVAALIKKQDPSCTLVVSSGTETGHAEALRSLPFADKHMYLPFDYSWITRKVVREVQPDLVILSESDYWYNFLRYAKRGGAFLAIASGKLSERSALRHQKYRWLSKKLFLLFDLVCAQNSLQQKRFEQAGVPANRIIVTGNVKFDAEYPLLAPDQIQQLTFKLGITAEDFVLVIGSTHNPEEEQLLAVLESLWRKIPRLKVLLAPRHIERTSDIVQLLHRRGVDFALFSTLQPSGACTKANLIVVDVMGQLKNCYQLAHVAIVAGSYATHVGGHNILEPCGYGVPVLFGPYMFSQAELLEIVLAGKAGLQIPIEQLEATIVELANHPEKRQRLGQAGLVLIAENRGAAQKTLDAIENEQKQGTAFYHSGKSG